MATQIQRVNPLPEIGTSGIGRAVTHTLYVSPEGGGGNGKTWASAFTTIQAALAAAPTDPDQCTLIWISPHLTNYDIYTTGDPTFAGNYILQGTHRTWAKIKNTHGSATSILKFTGRMSLINLNFNLGTGSGTNGVISTAGAFRVKRCQFVGDGLTTARTALHIDAASQAKHGKVNECSFLGNDTNYMTGIVADNCSRSEFNNLKFHNCKTAIQVVENSGTSDQNIFTDIDMGDNGIGFDFDAGDEQHVTNVLFHDNTTNIDVLADTGTNHYVNMWGEFNIKIEPDNLVGTSVSTGAANTYGSDTELRAAATSTKPFRIVGIHLQPSTSDEWYQVALSSDSGSTAFDVIQFIGNKREGVAAPSGTEYIFDKGTRISAKARDVGGSDTVKVWLEIQEV